MTAEEVLNEFSMLINEVSKEIYPINIKTESLDLNELMKVMALDRLTGEIKLLRKELSKNK